jgi:hypothetical protein
VTIDIAANEKITYDDQYPLGFSKLSSEENFLHWMEVLNYHNLGRIDYESYLIL